MNIKNFTSVKGQGYFVAAAMLVVLTFPNVAHAQAGGGGNFLSGFINWIQGNVITTLSTLAVIVVGLVLMSMRASFVVILAVCAGIWLIFNAQTVASMLHS